MIAVSTLSFFLLAVFPLSLCLVDLLELNDPAEQLRRMTAQAQAQDAGDDEAHPVDKHFCSKCHMSNNTDEYNSE